ncbi:MAG TPA: TIGR00153 family protein [Methanocella sp.]|nr:TIGR00153 family protein [Methanocella sp.]
MTDPLRSILDLFAKSPFKPLTEHSQKVKLTVLKMDEAVKAYVAGDMAKVNELYEQINELEHEADRVKNEIRVELPSTLLMPVDRTDILTFLKQQDDVANSAEMVAQMLTLRPVTMNQQVKDVILKLERSVLTTVDEHVEAVGKIADLLDSSFSSKRVKEIQEIIGKVDSQKHQVDVIRRDAMKIIYDNEKDITPVGVYFLIELVKEMSWVAGHAENSSDRLRLITAKR